MLQENIKKHRKLKGWSQESLSRHAKITYSTLIKIESGVNKNPTLDTVKKIAAALNISIDKLVE